VRESPRPEFHHSGIIEVLFGGAFNVVVRFAGCGRSGQRDTELIAEVERKGPRSLCIRRKGKLGMYSPFSKLGALTSRNPPERRPYTGLHDFHKFSHPDAGSSGQRESFRKSIDLERKDQVHIASLTV